MSLESEKADSAFALREHVWPEIGPLVGGGHLVSVEEVVGSPFADKLDMLAGVDAWQIVDGHLMRPIAARVQEGTNWRSFTVRRDRVTGTRTEYEKYLTAIQEGGLYPRMVVHAYVAEKRVGPLLAAAAVPTEELVALCPGAPVRRNGVDGSSFYVVYWDRLRAAGAHIVEVGRHVEGVQPTLGVF